MAEMLFTHFVFVDFENVPTLDLGVIGDLPLQVTLLIGKNQKKIDLNLVKQICTLGNERVLLIEVGASGRNALDLTLGYYLGQAAVRSPDARFFIVSKDKDFDPLITHLQANRVHVSRHDAFAALPFLSSRKRAGLSGSPVDVNATNGAGPPASAGSAVDRFEKLIERMRYGGSAHRPKKRSTLVHHLSAFHGNKLSEEDVNRLVAGLEERGVIRIDPKHRVSYF